MQRLREVSLTCMMRAASEFDAQDTEYSVGRRSVLSPQEVNEDKIDLASAEGATVTLLGVLT